MAGERPLTRFDAGLFKRRGGFGRSLAIIAAVMSPMFLLLLFAEPQSGGPLAPLARVGLGLIGSLPYVALFALAAWFHARRELLVGGALTIGEDAVHFAGQRLCGRTEIDTALVTPRQGNKPIVVLRRRIGEPIRLEVENVARGRAIASALGLDPGHNVSSFSLPTLKQGIRAAVFAVASVIGLGSVLAVPYYHSPWPLLVGLVSTVVYLAFARAARTSLEVGADGLRIQCLGTTRFVAHDEIASAGVLRGPYMGVAVVLRSGEVLKLPTATHAAGDGGLAAGIVEMIEAARAPGRKDAAREESLLARRGRAAGDWLRQIRSLAAGANADHRTAPVETDRVWSVLEDPAADPSARVGAAAMLAASADEGARTRLRVAAKGIAAPRVRVAMEAVVDGEDDDAILEALEGVEERRGARLW